MNSGYSRAKGAFIVILIAMAIIAALCFVLSETPVKALSLFFLGPFSSLYSLGNMLASSTVLILGGLGVSIAMKGSSFNLGGEGQIYLGGFVAAVSGVALQDLGMLGTLIAIAAGSLASGAIAGFSGWCRMKWKTSEMISSFLLSSALVMVINYLITGPFLDPGSNLLTTQKVPQAMRLSKILPPSGLSTAILIAIASAAVIQAYLYRTKGGYSLRITGMSYRYAVYSGLNTRVYTWLPMFLSGTLYGMGGALSVFGTYYACVRDFQSGLGWNGFAVALIAGSNPVLVIPAALFFAWIQSGARIAMQGSDLTSQVASIAQAVIFFLITCEAFGRTRKKGGVSCK